MATFQAKWRAYAARKEFRRRLERLKQKCVVPNEYALFFAHDAVTHLVSWPSPVRVFSLSPFLSSEGAVRVLQAALRGWLQRQAYLWELEFFKENEASVLVLQAAYRGTLRETRSLLFLFLRLLFLGRRDPMLLPLHSFSGHKARQEYLARVAFLNSQETVVLRIQVIRAPRYHAARHLTGQLAAIDTAFARHF